MTPTPGQPLSEADVSLLKKGDLLRALKPAYGPEVRIETGDVVAFEKTEHGLIGVLGDFWGAHAFTFVERPHAPVSRPVSCAHEAYQGRCAHCGVPIVNGFPKYPAPPAEPVSRPAGEGEREAVARIIDPSAFLFAPDELPKGSRAQYDAFDKADAIISLLSPAAPDAGGGGEEDIMRTQEDWSALLYGRDSFIVRKGLWSEFVDSLPDLQPGGER